MYQVSEWKGIHLRIFVLRGVNFIVPFESDEDEESNGTVFGGTYNSNFLH